MPCQVKLLRRMGQNPVGSIRLYSDDEAYWLVTNGHAEYVDSVETAPAVPVHVDEHQDHGEPQPTSPTLATLKAAAERMGLPTYGTKAQLADRIDQHRTTPDDPDDDLDDEEE